MKLYRGQSSETWERRLALRGWPEGPARIVSRFLTGEIDQLPRWQDLQVSAKFPVGPEPERDRGD